MVYYTPENESLIGGLLAFGFALFVFVGFFYVLLLAYWKFTGRIKRVSLAKTAEKEGDEKGDYGKLYGGSFGVKFGTFGGIKWWQKW